MLVIRFSYVFHTTVCVSNNPVGSKCLDIATFLHNGGEVLSEASALMDYKVLRNLIVCFILRGNAYTKYFRPMAKSGVNFKKKNIVTIFSIWVRKLTNFL